MNFGSVCVLIVLVLIVALIIRGMIKDKKAGKNIICSDCDCDCGCSDGACPSSQMAVDLAKAMEQEYSRRKEQKES